jgi:hypothetical protein
MFPRILSGVFFIVSWLVAFIIGKKNIRRFAPVAILSIFLVTLVELTAYHLNWWRFKRILVQKINSVDLAILLGPFFIGTIGIFSLTYRFGFRVYLLANIILDSFFSYIILPFLEKIGLLHLTKITRTGVNFLMISVAVVIYPFQKWIDGSIFNKKRKRLFKK